MPAVTLSYSVPIWYPIPVVLTTTTVTQPSNLIWFSVQNDLFQTSEDPLEVFPSLFQPRPGNEASVLIME